MKLSVDDMTGPDPEKAALCMRAIITLDGKKVERCVMADEEEGFVVQHSLDPSGQLYVDERGEVASEIRYGKVRIIDPDETSLEQVYLR